MNVKLIAEEKIVPVSDQYHDWYLNKIKLLAAATLPLALAIASPSALAAVDGKDYAGAQCQPETKDAPYLITSIGAMLNVGSTPLVVFCPAINDQGSTKITGRVSVTDVHLSQQVVCTLSSRDIVSGSGASSTRSNPTAVNFAGESILFNTTVASSSNRYISYRCTIPPFQPGAGFSQITSYEVDEL